MQDTILNAGSDIIFPGSRKRPDPGILRNTGRQLFADHAFITAAGNDPVICHDDYALALLIPDLFDISLDRIHRIVDSYDALAVTQHDRNCIADVPGHRILIWRTDIDSAAAAHSAFIPGAILSNIIFRCSKIRYKKPVASSRIDIESTGIGLYYLCLLFNKIIDQLITIIKHLAGFDGDLHGQRTCFTDRPFKFIAYALQLRDTGFFSLLLQLCKHLVHIHKKKHQQQRGDNYVDDVTDSSSHGIRFLMIKQCQNRPYHLIFLCGLLLCFNDTINRLSMLVN